MLLIHLKMNVRRFDLACCRFDGPLDGSSRPLLSVFGTADGACWLQVGLIYLFLLPHN